jgi:hypothetical protein
MPSIAWWTPSPFETAVAEDLPGLHPGEGVLDAGTDLAVRRVVFLFPGREFGLARFAVVRDDQAGAAVAAVGDHGGGADGVLRSGQPEDHLRDSP